MKKWEYNTFYFPQRLDHNDDEWDKRVKEQLNIRGESGWELVNASYIPPSGTPPYPDELATAAFKYGDWHFFLKREIEEKNS